MKLRWNDVSMTYMCLNPLKKMLKALDEIFN